MLKLFEYDNSEVRVVTDDQGNPRFVAKDVCDILGLANHRSAILSMPKKQKGVHSIDTLGGEQEVATVSEAGLYQLVFKSRKEEAIKFQDWITEDVIPTIRKTGSYSMKPMSQAEMLLAQAQVAVEHEKRLANVEGELHELKAQVTTINTDYYTISGYCSLKNLRSIPLMKSQIIGKKCSKLSKELDYAIGSAYDAKYGHINTYHIDVLSQVLGK